MVREVEKWSGFRHRITIKS